MIISLICADYLLRRKSKTVAMLCEKCKVIELDDRLPEFKEITLKDGQVVLEYVDEDAWEGELDDGNEAAPQKSMIDLDLYDRLQYPNLDYKHQDTFPDFPGLKSSAAEGCEFCNLLRTTLQEHFADQLAPLAKDSIGVGTVILIFMLRYRWDLEAYRDTPEHHDDGSGRGGGITALEFSAITETDLFRFFSFDVVGIEGKSE